MIIIPCLKNITSPHKIYTLFNQHIYGLCVVFYYSIMHLMFLPDFPNKSFLCGIYLVACHCSIPQDKT